MLEQKTSAPQIALHAAYDDSRLTLNDTFKTVSEKDFLSNHEAGI